MLVVLLAGLNFVRSQDYTPGSHPGFASYESLPVHRSLMASQPLCHPDVVTSTCHAINANTPEMYATPTVAGSQKTDAEAISFFLAADPGSVTSFLQEVLGRSGGFSCQELCEKLVASSPPQTLPSASDVGCYIPSAGGDPICKVDLSTSSLKNITFADLPAPERAFGASLITGIPDQPVPLEEQAAFEASPRPTRQHESLRRELLEFFHIYPVSQASVINKAPNARLLESSGRRLVTADIEMQLLETALTGKAYMNTALFKMANGTVAEFVSTWFGNNAYYPTRQVVTRVLNEASAKMNNLAFYYPGPICPRAPAGTVGYVEPYTANKTTQDGRYIIFLCDFYFQVSESEKVQTLVHEVTHHDPTYTQDYAYGRDNCKSMALACFYSGISSSEECKKARSNADTHTFFVSDANGVEFGMNPTQPGVIEQVGEGLNGAANTIGDTAEALGAPEEARLPIVLTIALLAVCGICCIAGSLVYFLRSSIGPKPKKKKKKGPAPALQAMQQAVMPGYPPPGYPRQPVVYQAVAR